MKLVITNDKGEKQKIKIRKGKYESQRIAIYVNDVDLTVDSDEVLIMVDEIILNIKDIQPYIINKLYEEGYLTKTRRSVITKNYMYPVVKLTDKFLKELE